MRLGIIGTGRMGGMLARAFANTGMTSILLYTRTLEKAAAIQDEFRDVVSIATSMTDLVANADYIFLCMKSPEVDKWIEIWADQLAPSQCVVSINSQISLAELEFRLPAQVMKAIPSITQTAEAGIILYMPGANVSEQSLNKLLHLFSTIGHPLLIDENMTRIYADLSSCGPAFFAVLIQQMADSAQKKGVPADTAEHLLIETLTGFTLLIQVKGLSLADVIQAVSVPGGVTEAGVKHLRQTIPAVFDQLFNVTAQRQKELDQLS